MKKIYACIDIGSDTIRVLVSEYFQNKFRTLAVSSVRSKGVKNGEIIDSWYRVSITKKWDDEKEPCGATKVSYGVPCAYDSEG